MFIREARIAGSMAESEATATSPAALAKIIQYSPTMSTASGTGSILAGGVHVRPRLLTAQATAMELTVPRRHAAVPRTIP